MRSGYYKDVPADPIEKYGSVGAEIRWLIRAEEGSGAFSMRVVTIQPGGHIGLHSHAEEHQIFVLSGQGRALSGGRGAEMARGAFLHLLGGEEHIFENAGSDSLEFICCISNPDK